MNSFIDPRTLQAEPDSRVRASRSIARTLLALLSGCGPQAAQILVKADEFVALLVRRADGSTLLAASESVEIEPDDTLFVFRVPLEQLVGPLGTPYGSLTSRTQPGLCPTGFVPETPPLILGPGESARVPAFATTEVYRFTDLSPRLVFDVDPEPERNRTWIEASGTCTCPTPTTPSELRLCPLSTSLETWPIHALGSSEQGWLGLSSHYAAYLGRDGRRAYAFDDSFPKKPTLVVGLAGGFVALSELRTGDLVRNAGAHRISVEGEHISSRELAVSPDWGPFEFGFVLGPDRALLLGRKPGRADPALLPLDCTLSDDLRCEPVPIDLGPCGRLGRVKSAARLEDGTPLTTTDLGQLIEYRDGRWRCLTERAPTSIYIGVLDPLIVLCEDESSGIRVMTSTVGPGGPYRQAHASVRAKNCTHLARHDDSMIVTTDAESIQLDRSGKLIAVFEPGQVPDGLDELKTVRWEPSLGKRISIDESGAVWLGAPGQTAELLHGVPVDQESSFVPTPEGVLELGRVSRLHAVDDRCAPDPPELLEDRAYEHGSIFATPDPEDLRVLYVLDGSRRLFRDSPEGRELLVTLPAHDATKVKGAVLARDTLTFVDGSSAVFVVRGNRSWTVESDHPASDVSASNGVALLAGNDRVGRLDILDSPRLIWFSLSKVLDGLGFADAARLPPSDSEAIFARCPSRAVFAAHVRFDERNGSSDESFAWLELGSSGQPPCSSSTLSSGTAGELGFCVEPPTAIAELRSEAPVGFVGSRSSPMAVFVGPGWTGVDTRPVIFPADLEVRAVASDPTGLSALELKSGQGSALTRAP
ncbi:MAG: hypothetical protein HY791_23365 [Deltaproteobacteria bacterium]|nr:hypothetical protein [Deltaproteobacteria bacterium]